MPAKDEFRKFLKEKGEKFMQLRNQVGKDIATVAAESGLSEEEVKNIEKGKSSQYQLQKLYDLCDYYKVDSREILGT
jgi:transcriptional regulator with XRE-family HTH domain